MITPSRTLLIAASPVLSVPIEVALKQVACRARAFDDDAVPTVAGDDVPRRDTGTANRIARCAGDDNPVAGVAKVELPGCVGADEVALHEVARRTAVRTKDDDAKVAVSRDEVARAGYRPADGIVLIHWDLSEFVTELIATPWRELPSLLLPVTSVPM